MFKLTLGISDDYLPGLWDNYPILQQHPPFEQCRSIADLQALAAQWSMVIGLCMGIPSIITGPFFGSLSDKVGRRPIILLSLFCAIILFLALVVVEKFNVGLWVVMAFITIQASMGGLILFGTSAYSFLADSTTPEERGRFFVGFQAIAALAMSIGPILGGIMARRMANGAADVIYVCFACSNVMFIGNYFFLPESLDLSKVPVPSELEKKASVLDAIRSSIKSALKTIRDACSPTFLLLLVSNHSNFRLD